MKNSKEYSGKIKKLFNSLKRKHSKPTVPDFGNLIEALVCGVLSEYGSGKDAESAMKRFGRHFMDFNDLRVSRSEEIMEALSYPKDTASKTAKSLIACLNAVFDKYDCLELGQIAELGKRQGREELEKFEPLSRFVVDFIMLTAMQGHSMPLTEKMLGYLRANELVHPEADDRNIQGFLEKQISASSGYSFYALLRQESETASVARKEAVAKPKAESGKAEPKPKSKSKAKKAVKSRTKKTKSATVKTPAKKVKKAVKKKSTKKKAAKK